ncbi:MAG TPA: glycosyltransferase [Usitatibacter sp.]|nr:glycosyltransferase [Usitatibacter sp.]
MRIVLLGMEWFFLLYFVLGAAGYLVLDLLAIASLHRRIGVGALEDLPPAYPGFERPVSLLVPAYNAEATIASAVRSLLQLDYPEFEIVVVNDGSADATLEALREAFQLEVFPEAHCRRLKAQAVRAIYHSKLHANLRVVDKENGGRADSLNVGINASRYPLFCAMDADAILQRESLRRVTQPFHDDRRTVAASGAVRIAEGPSPNLLALLQVVEHLRAFVFGRLGWARMNAVLAIPGAFAVFRKDTVVEVGGYRTGTIAGDMDLVVRLHCLLRTRREPYAIQLVADPVCWTEATGQLGALGNQRIGWQRRLAEGVYGSRDLIRAGGAPGFIALPFLTMFECYGPLIEIAGYLFMALMFFLGQLSGAAFGAFLALAFSLGFLLSVSALLLEELFLRPFPRLSQMAVLVGVAVLENLGYRQLVSLWRLAGLVRWAREASQR